MKDLLNKATTLQRLLEFYINDWTTALDGEDVVKIASLVTLFGFSMDEATKIVEQFADNNGVDLI